MSEGDPFTKVEYGKAVVAFGTRMGAVFLGAFGGMIQALTILGEDACLKRTTPNYRGRIMVWEGDVTVVHDGFYDVSISGGWRRPHADELKEFLEGPAGPPELMLRVTFPEPEKGRKLCNSTG